ncbi:hypothetical protein [Lujinxingia vulgaris]|nr:hypothetical protein [Lujinxingia vulgaris]
MKPILLVTAALLALPAAAHAQTQLVNPDWELSDDFESAYEEGF